MEIWKVFLGLYALGIIAVIVGVIYLVFRRVRVKKGENFEKRDN